VIEKQEGTNLTIYDEEMGEGACKI